MKDIHYQQFGTSKQRILITGATGCIGRALVHRLARRGNPVTVLVRSQAKFEEAFADLIRGSDIKVVEGDLMNKPALRLAAESVGTVLHAAAYVHVRARDADSIAEMYEVNVRGTQNLLHTLDGQSLQRFVFFSTIGVYGRSALGVLSETTRCNPDSPYAQSKLEAEQLISKFFEASPMVPIIFRLSMVYGEGDRGNFSRLIRAIENGRFLEIDRGRTLKSMMYVENVVDATLLAICRDQARGQTFVLSDTDYYTMRFVVRTIARHLGKSAPRFSLPAFIFRHSTGLVESAAYLFGKKPLFTSEDLAALLSDTICDCSKTRTLLSFEPKITLDEGVRRTINWRRTKMIP